MNRTRNKPKMAPSDLLDLLGGIEPFQVNSEPITSAYSVTVDDNFDSVRQFEGIVRCLERARQGDTLEIKLSTDGGSLHAVLPVLCAMQETQAQVYVHAESDVASAGTLLLLAADGVKINPYITIMFHQEQFGSGGPGSSVESYVTHTRRSTKLLMEDFYGDFFTEEELKDMRNGKDFYMDKEEFEKRYVKRLSIRQNRLKEKLEAKPPRKPRKKKAEIQPEE